MTDWFDYRALAADLASLPPAVHAILASHAVPYGRVYRQWDASGNLLVWVNRGEIEDLAIRSAFSDLWNPIISPALIGIPVVKV